jgi:hypothetical protein
VHSRGKTWQKMTSEYRRVITKKATLTGSPPIRTVASPKSAYAWAGMWLSGTNTSA